MLNDYVASSFKIDRWYCHKWVPGVYHSNDLFGATVDCTEVVAGVGAVNYKARVWPGDCVVTDLATGYRHILPKEQSIGLVS